MTTPDHPNRDSNPSPFAGLPDFPGNRFVISEVACQECEEVRPGIKSYTVLHVVYLILFAYWRWDTHVKCPQCMRVYLCQRLFPALFLANFAAPIVFIWWTVLFVRTFFQ